MGALQTLQRIFLKEKWPKVAKFLEEKNSSHHISTMSCSILPKHSMNELNFSNTVYNVSSLTCSQILLRSLVGDHQHSYLTKLEKKKNPAGTIVKTPKYFWIASRHCKYTILRKNLKFFWVDLKTPKYLGCFQTL